MQVAALTAFVAGTWWLQQQGDLPSMATQVRLLSLALSLILLLISLQVLRRLPMRATSPLERHVLTVTIVKTITALGWVLSCALLGFVLAAWRADLALHQQLAAADEGKNLVVVGVIDSLPTPTERGQRFEFAVEQVEGTKPPPLLFPRRLMLSWINSPDVLRPAQRWRFTVRLKQPHGTLNPGGFDAEGWLLERGIGATGYVRTTRDDVLPQRLAEQVNQPSALLDRLRHALRERLQQRLGESRYGGVLIALVLGDQRAIRDDDWSLFNRAGISHLISISGLHITMVAGLLALIVAQLWRRSYRCLLFAPAQTAAAVAGVLAALCYCLLAGWGVPAQRTFFMLTVVAAALLLRWQASASLTLALAATVVCLLDPWAVIAPGFWLSFAAVAAILFAAQGRVINQAANLRAKFFAAVQVQWAVTLALLPLTVALFQQVSLISPLANAIAIPLVSLVVTPLALIAGVLVVLPEPLASGANFFLLTAHFLMQCLGSVLQLAAPHSWTQLALPAPPAWAVLSALIGVAWLLAPRGWPLRGLGVLPLLPLFVLPAPRPAAGELWVTALDVGQGMAVLVQSPSYTLLYDAGPRFSADSDAGSRVILPYLRWQGINRLDALVISHQDIDHSGGAASVLRGVDVRQVVSSVPTEHPLLDRRPAQRCEAGLRLGDASIPLSVLHPLAADYLRVHLSTNAKSCVLQLRLPHFGLLLTGDLPAREEAELVKREADLRTTLLTAPHHGSRHSSSAAFIAATQPTWVVVQAGYRNRFGHPATEVLTRLHASNAHVLRTDHAGALQWRIDSSGKLSVSAMREPRRRYWHHVPAKVVLPAEAADDEHSVADPALWLDTSY